MGFRFGQFLIVTLLQGMAITLLSRFLSGVHVDNIWTAIFGTAIIVAATGRLWPLVYSFSSRFKPVLFPIFVFALTGLTVLTVSGLFALVDFDGLRVDGLGTAIVVALVLASVNTIVAAFFADDDRAYDRYVTRPIMQSRSRAAPSASPGVLFVEIDGLPGAVLQEAIARGRMPVVKRWLASGEYELTGWEPDLSSQTAASQAGILLGSNENIPAFRWYDRAEGRLLVSSSLKTAALVEDRLSRGEGLLTPGGASRSNMFSGDTTDSLLTFATIGRRRAGEETAQTSPGSYYLFFANPFTIVRFVIFLIYDVGLEIFQSTRQKVMRVQPRLKRGGIYPLIRSFTTAASPEINTYMVISDIARGVPSLYATYYAYDEVAHHSGVRSPDVMGVLRRLDRHLGRIERAIRDAPRPYHLVVLSDHGQSNGSTFLQRYGETLGEYVGRSLPGGHTVAMSQHGSEAMAHLEAAASEAENQGTKAAGMARRAVNVTSRSAGITASEATPVSDNQSQASNIHVLASGNLGLIYDSSSNEQLTLEAITTRFPDLLPALIGHDGIGFVRVHTEADGAVVIGRSGRLWLETGRVDGVDPLIGFGPNAAQHLLRHSRFTNSPDILVNSRYWADRDEVAAFEELVGSHGGLGGTQTRPFVLHPALLNMGVEPVVGTGALHTILKGWIAATT